MTNTISVDDYHRLTKRKRSKYGNHRVVLNGHTFDSQAEAERYGKLKLFEAGGEIRDLEVHPSFVLQAAFRHAGKTERAITYQADFAYTETESGRRVIEDIKGTRTQVYLIKRKLFLARYGDAVEFREVSV